MSSSRNKFFSGGKLSNKSTGSSGLRILWIPGRHKSHPKGRYDSTNKQVVHKNGQKKSEAWSLGGSKNQRDLIDSEPDTNLFEGPSVSGITQATCALGVVGVEKCVTNIPTISVPAAEDSKNADANSSNAKHTSISTPTILLVNLPNTPDTAGISKTIATSASNATDSANSSDDSMPAKTTFTTVTRTITAEIMDENRFSILDKDIPYEFDVDDLPIPPKVSLLNTPSPDAASSMLLNSSAGTTASTESVPSPSTTSKQQNEKDSVTGSPAKKKNHKNENNNHQNDINSIESLSDNMKIPSSDLDWLDELPSERDGKELLDKNKKKKKISTTKELDQLDGVPSKHNTINDDKDEDEKVVKCLYYTLMCCECTIS